MWKVDVLEDACTFISRGISPKYIDEGGILVLNQKCVRSHAIDYSLARRHDIKIKNVKPERFIQRGDVLINSTGQGTLGRVAQVRQEPPEPTTVDSHITIVRPNLDKFYLEYFGYALIQIEEELKNSGQGTSGQTELAKTRVQKEFFASYPSDKAEQQRIVAKLDAAFAEIDRAVEVTEHQISYAERLKSNSLTSLFFDREHVVKKLCELALIKGGKRLPKGKKLTTENTGFPYIRVSDFNDNGTVEEASVQFVEPDVQSQISRYTISSEDVYVSIAGTIGKTGIVPPNLDNANLTENAAKLVFNDGVDRDFVYFFTQTSSFEKQAIVQTRQTAQPKLALERLGAVKLPFYELHQQRQIAANAKLMTLKIGQFLDNRKDRIVRLDALKKAILTQELQPSEAA